jgi:CAAX prenyl protease N-terminal, five membrane helices
MRGTDFFDASLKVKSLADMKTSIILLSCLINFIVVSGQTNQQGVKHDRPDTVHFDPEKATIELLNTITPTERQKADNYTEGGYWLILWNIVNEALIAWIFLFQGLSGYLKKLCSRISNGDWGQLTYISLYFILSFLLSLPLSIYQNVVRENQYGFFNQVFIRWLSKDLLGFIIEFVILVPLSLFVYTNLSKTKENIRIRRMTMSIDVIMGVFFLKPVFAEVTHELVPYSRSNLLEINLEYGILIIAGCLLVIRTFHKLISRYGNRLKLENNRDISSLPLLVFLIACYFFIITPLSNTIKRNSELEADIYRLNTTRDPDAFALFVLKTADHDKADPGYWEEFFFFDHPGLKKRIYVAMKWKAENFILLPFFDMKGFGC